MGFAGFISQTFSTYSAFSYPGWSLYVVKSKERVQLNQLLNPLHTSLGSFHSVFFIPLSLSPSKCMKLYICKYYTPLIVCKNLSHITDFTSTNYSHTGRELKDLSLDYLDLSWFILIMAKSVTCSCPTFHSLTAFLNLQEKCANVLMKPHKLPFYYMRGAPPLAIGDWQIEVESWPVSTLAILPEKVHW